MAHALLATMRDEAPFLLEWVAYHRAIGFDRIVVYSNDCTDGTDAMLAALDRAGVLTHLPHAPPPKQSVARIVADDAMTRALFAPGDWVIWLDADEFLNIHLGDGHLTDLTGAIEAAGAEGACLSWRIFGDAGREDVPNGFLSPDFTRCAAPGGPWINVKTLFRQSDAVRAYFQHRPIMTAEFWDGAGRFLAGTGRDLTADGRQMHNWRQGQKRGKIDAGDAGWEWAQINHYAVRTRPHFEAKRARGRIGRPNEGGAERYTETYFEGLNRNDDEDLSILRWQAATQAGIAELEELMAKTQKTEDSQDFDRYRQMHASHNKELEERVYSNRRLAGEIARQIGPGTAVDLGCGIGILMSELKETGIDIRGVEGLWLDDEAMVLPPEHYIRADLEAPLVLDAQFDLAISIEVAEHLEPDRAAGFVADLCTLADAVVFSAAIPGQGGKGHKNEQWQSYWAALFVEQGYDVYDIFRPVFMRDPELMPWFRQNPLLYLRRGHRLEEKLSEARIPLEAADMILPAYHRKAMRRTRRALKAKLAEARRS
ncbi:MAG: glycosyltransferase family 2 protein [Silicimonas sp.]|nr:glycosyltransferase family 2 protein [Silicimonas sp.]